MSIEFKIGMIAPTSAGKSSLLLAIYDEVCQRVIQDNLKFRAADSETNKAMNRVQSQFRSSIDSAKNSSDGLFVVPNLAGTEQSDTFNFTLIIPSQDNSNESSSQNVQFSIKDYSGGLLGTAQFETEIVPFLNESVTLLVPISADLAMTCSETAGKRGDALCKNALAREKLQIDNVITSIRDWIKFKVNHNMSAQLVFVPIKCEKYFNDNGGFQDQSKELINTVRELYIKELETRLKSSLKSDEVEKVNQLISCKIFSVDTYGIAELSRVVLEYNDKHEPYGLKSSFRRKPQMGNDIKMKNAYELLIDIIVFQVTEILNDLNRAKNDANVDLKEYVGVRSWGDWVKDGLGSLLGNWYSSPLEVKKQKIESLLESIKPVEGALDILNKKFVEMSNRQLQGPIISQRD